MGLELVSRSVILLFAFETRVISLRGIEHLSRRDKFKSRTSPLGRIFRQDQNPALIGPIGAARKSARRFQIARCARINLFPVCQTVIAINHTWLQNYRFRGVESKAVSQIANFNKPFEIKFRSQNLRGNDQFVQNFKNYSCFGINYKFSTEIID